MNDSVEYEDLLRKNALIYNSVKVNPRILMGDKSVYLSAEDKENGHDYGCANADALVRGDFDPVICKQRKCAKSSDCHAVPHHSSDAFCSSPVAAPRSQLSKSVGNHLTRPSAIAGYCDGRCSQSGGSPAGPKMFDLESDPDGKSQASDKGCASFIMEKFDLSSYTLPRLGKLTGLGSFIETRQPSPRPTYPPDYFKIYIEDIIMGIDRRRTCMIRNIPNKYTQRMLIDFLNEDHYGRYNFLYLRMDFKNQCNVGYAFVNFNSCSDVISFYKKINGKRWKNFTSNKIAELTYASVQGLPSLINKFKNSCVLLEKESYRPKVFYTKGPNKGRERFVI